MLFAIFNLSPVELIILAAFGTLVLGGIVFLVITLTRQHPPHDQDHEANLEDENRRLRDELHRRDHNRP